MGQWCLLLTSILGTSLVTWWPCATASGSWTRSHGTVAWDSGVRSSPAYWRQGALLTAEHCCYRLLNKLIRFHHMEQWCPLFTGLFEMSMLSWQLYITVSGCWRRWFRIIKWSSGVHFSPVHQRQACLADSCTLLLQSAEQDGVGLSHGVVVSASHKFSWDKYS